MNATTTSVGQCQKQFEGTLAPVDSAQQDEDWDDELAQAAWDDALGAAAAAERDEEIAHEAQRQWEDVPDEEEPRRAFPHRHA